MAKKPKAPAIFTKKRADGVYTAIVSGLRGRVGKGRAVEELKGTCVHIVAGKDGTAYAGLHPRTEAVLLNIVTAAALKSPRIRKAEQRSKSRWHCEMLVSSAAEVDEEVLGWLQEAEGLVSNKAK